LFDTITYTSTLTPTTNEETVTVSHSSSSHPHAFSPSPTTTQSHCQSHATAINVVTYVPPVPHPTELVAPHPDEEPDAYWIITIGQEVGIFYHWYVTHVLIFNLIPTIFY
jgi:hypothetical protein